MFDRILSTFGDDEEPLEDPMTLEIMDRKNMCILPCCSSIMDRNNLDMCNGRCPVCRAPLRNDAVLSVDAATEMIDSAAGAAEEARAREEEEKRKAEEEEAAARDAMTRVDPDARGNNRVFERRIRDCVKQSLPGIFDYLSVILNATMDWKSNCRILICFSMYDPENDIGKSMRGTCAQITSRCPRMRRDQIGFVKRRGKHSVSSYKTIDDKPRVLLINTAHGSNSLEGLDLNDTDLVIMDKTQGYLQPGVLTQAIGRAMRPQRLPPGADWYTFQHSDPFPSKRIIYIHRSYRNEPIEQEEGEDEDNEELLPMADDDNPVPVMRMPSPVGDDDL